MQLGVKYSQSILDNLRKDELAAENKIKNATFYYEKIVREDPNKPMIDKAKKEMDEAGVHLNNTRDQIANETLKRNKLQQESWEMSQVSIKKAMVVLDAQMKTGVVHKQVIFGENKKVQLTTLELVFIIMFAVVASSLISSAILYKLNGGAAGKY